MIKHMISALMMMLFALGSFMSIPINVLADTTKDGLWEYETEIFETENNEGEQINYWERITLTDYYGEKTYVIVPDEVDGKTVKEIGEGLFKGSESLKSVSFPENIIIGIEAFMGCEGLESVYIPTGTLVCAAGFSDCTGLKELSFGNTNVTDITDVTEDAGIWLTGAAFSGCTGLETLSIPSGCWVSVDCFSGCTSLESLSIDSVADYKSFEGCIALENIEFGENIVCVYPKAFLGCTDLKEVYIPDNVVKIGEYAFGYTEDYEKVEGFVIKGYTGAAAEVYAKENGFEFVSLGEAQNTSDNVDYPPGYEKGDYASDDYVEITEDGKDETPDETETVENVKKESVITVNKTIVRRKAVKKRDVKIKISAETDGQISYKNVTKGKQRKYIKVSSKGVVTIKKNAVKGKYRIKVKILEGEIYGAHSQNVLIRVE